MRGLRLLCEVGITIDRIEGLLKLALDSSPRHESSSKEVEIDFYDAVSQFEVLNQRSAELYTRQSEEGWSTTWSQAINAKHENQSIQVS
jgi:N6-adenosine-specific RNA methylase IME4